MKPSTCFLQCQQALKEPNHVSKPWTIYRNHCFNSPFANCSKDMTTHGLLVTTWWHVLRLWMEKTSLGYGGHLQICWTHSCRHQTKVKGLTVSHHKKLSCYEILHRAMNWMFGPVAGCQHGTELTYIIKGRRKFCHLNDHQHPKDFVSYSWSSMT